MTATPSSLLALTLLALLPPARGQGEGQAAPAPQEPALFADLRQRGPLPSPVSEAALKDLVRRLVPEVERLAGREFAQPVRSRISTVQDVARSLNQDFLLQYEHIYPEFSERRRAWLAGLGAQALSAGMLGKYGMVDQTLHLLPQRITPILELFDFDEGLGRGLFVLIVAHELVHALQDQHIHLAQRAARLRDRVDIATFVTAIEGQAEYVSGRLAQELGLERESEAFSKMVRLETHRELVPRNNTEIVAREHRLLQQFGYVDARDHLRALSPREALERSWRYLEQPLASTAPYFGIDGAQPESSRIAKALVGIEAFLGPGRWSLARTRVDALALQSEFTEAKATELRPHLAALRGAHEVEACLPPLLMRVRVGAFAFADPEAARRFVRAAGEWWQREDDVFLLPRPVTSRGSGEETGPRSSKRFRQRPLSEVPGLRPPEGATGFLQYAQLGRGLITLECRALWVAHGRHVVHVFQQNRDLGGEELTRLLGVLFDRLGRDPTTDRR